MNVVPKSWFECFVLSGHSGHEDVDLKEIITGSLSSAVQCTTCTGRGHLDVEDIEEYPIIDYSHRVFSYSQYIVQQMHFVI
jgi:hypothetical protein